MLLSRKVQLIRLLSRGPSFMQPASHSSPTPAAGGSAVACHAQRGAYTYEWPRPAVTVDTVVIARHPKPSLLLIKRKFEPCKDAWALPGGFVDEQESLDVAAARELQEETSVDPSSVTLRHVGAFGDKGRDPRGWTITVAYGAIVDGLASDLNVKANDDAKEAEWFDVTALPKLAFDHKLVVREAFRRLAEGPEAKQGGLEGVLREAAGKLEGPWQE